MKRLLSMVAALMLMCVGFSAAANAAPAQGETEVITEVTFASADDVFHIDVEKARGAGALTADTSDCCVEGDIWRVDIHPDQPANPANAVTGIGNGSISEFSGAATAAPFVRGCVEISYEEGVDDFPALMSTRLRYSKSTGMIVSDVLPGSC